jgi:hypothetical protein
MLARLAAQSRLLSSEANAARANFPPLELPGRLTTWVAAWRITWRPTYPNCHLFFATLGLCDFVQTCMILSLGGAECNELARWVMAQWGLAGAAVYKFALVGMIIGIVEWTAFRDAFAAKRLATYSLILGAVPVMVGVPLLVLHFWAESI